MFKLLKNPKFKFFVYLVILSFIGSLVWIRLIDVETANTTNSAMRQALGNPAIMDPPVIGWAYRTKVAIQILVALAALVSAVLTIKHQDKNPSIVPWIFFFLSISTFALAYLNGQHVIGRNIAAICAWGSILGLLVWFTWFHFAVLPRVRNYGKTLEIASHAKHPLEE